MKKLLLDLHIYSNLLCAAYLLIYGLSTISFNHGHQPAERSRATWQRAIDVPGAETDQQLAEAVRRRLGLMGWVPKWRIERPADARLRFEIHRPARTYRLDLDQERGLVEVEEVDRGLWGAIRSLHGLSNVPGSAWSRTWGIYTEISIWALLFAVLSGLYLWWSRPSERRIGFWLLGLGSGGTLAFILYVMR